MIDIGTLQGRVVIEGVESAKSGIIGLSGGFEGALGAVKKFAAGIAIGTIIKKTTDALIDCGKSAMEFETSFAKVSTLLDETTTDLSAYKQELLEASNATGVSVNDLSEATYQAISAGQDAEDAIGFVVSANKLAKGGFTDTTKAVDIMTTALNAYGLESSEAKKVCDLLISTQNKGKTTVDELASSMGKIIPTAKANNVELEQLSAGYAILTANGISTAESTTYFNSMLNELAKGGTKVDGILREVAGSSFSELMASGQSVGDVLQIVNDYAVSTGVSFGDLWSSSEAGKAGMVLLGEGASTFNEMLLEMNDTTGATEEAFIKMSDTTADKMDKVKNYIDNLKIAVGDRLLPVVIQCSEWIIENVPKIIRECKPVFDFISESITITVELISNLINWLIEFWNSNIEVQEGVFTVWESIKEIFALAWETIQAGVDAFVEVFKYIWTTYGEEITVYIETIWNSIKILFETTFDAIVNILNIFKYLFTGDWDAMWKEVSKLVETVWNGITEWISNTLDGIVDIIDGIGPKLYDTGKAIFEWFWEGLKSMWTEIYEWVKAVAEQIGNALGFNLSSETKVKVDGSHRTGLSTVPYDNYSAMLHKGEMVLTQAEADRYRRQEQQVQQINNVMDTSNLENEISALRKDVRNIVRQYQVASNMA